MSKIIEFDLRALTAPDTEIGKMVAELDRMTLEDRRNRKKISYPVKIRDLLTNEVLAKEHNFNDARFTANDLIEQGYEIQIIDAKHKDVYRYIVEL